MSFDKDIGKWRGEQHLSGKCDCETKEELDPLLDELEEELPSMMAFMEEFGRICVFCLKSSGLGKRKVEHDEDCLGVRLSKALLERK